MSIFKGITKRNFIKDYDEKDGLPFFLMEDFESLDCDEGAKQKMTAPLQDMYPKFVETLKDESYYYSLVEKWFFPKNGGIHFYHNVQAFNVDSRSTLKA